ncbi:MAG: adenylate/guanylate cyclase domain-containing protein, partial [Chloroflexota bacterium]|nr:adenylate/guanylate cyclase domain-containing protein [Chloroflexota bacterium]
MTGTDDSTRKGNATMGERENLEAGIAAMEAQRALLGDAVVEAALAPMREKLASLLAPPPEEQRKLLTVLFADVSGFTALSETRDAEDVRELMNRLWDRLDAVLQAHGARIDKHIGDAVMALFGADAAREDDPERAVRAALTLQEALAHDAATLMEGAASAPPLRMRVGISTGLVLLGSVGTVGETTALGDTVNVASRLEGAAPVGGVLIAHDTYRHVRGLFDAQELPPLALKGKTEPVRAYLVARAKPRGFHLSPR